MTIDKRATILFDDLFVLADEIPSVRIQVIRDALHAATSELQNELEVERMRLAGCGVAAMANTEKTKADRLTKDNPYWSSSYGDVCAAVDREMKYRTSLEDMTESRDSWKEMAQNLGISLAILQDAAEKIVSDNAPSDTEMLKESKRDWDIRVLKEALKLAREVDASVRADACVATVAKKNAVVNTEGV